MLLLLLLLLLADTVHTDVHTVDLTGKGITHVPAALPAGTSALQLSSNRLGQLRARAFGGGVGRSGYGELHELRLGNNGMVRIEELAFAGLAQLRLLDLSGNALTYLPHAAFVGLVRLQSLQLGFNSLASVGAGCFGRAYLPRLAALDLSFNPMGDRHRPCAAGSHARAVVRGSDVWRLCQGSAAAPHAPGAQMTSTTGRGAPLPLAHAVVRGEQQQQQQQQRQQAVLGRAACAVTAWGEWEPQTGCPVPCGGGTRWRRREVRVAPSGGGPGCPALRHEAPCNTGPCPARLPLARKSVLRLFEHAAAITPCTLDEAGSTLHEEARSCGSYALRSDSARSVGAARGGQPPVVVVALAGLPGMGAHGAGGGSDSGGGGGGGGGDGGGGGEIAADPDSATGLLLAVLRDRFLLVHERTTAHGSASTTGVAREVAHVSKWGYAGIGTAQVERAQLQPAGATGSVPAPPRFAFATAWDAHFSRHTALKVRIADGALSAYFGYDGLAAVIGKAPGTPFAMVLDSGGDGARQGGTAEERYVYTAHRSFPSVVVKLKQSDMQLADVQQLGFQEDDVRCLLGDATHLYAFTNTVPSRVVRLSKHPLRRLGAAKLWPSENMVLGGAIDGDHLYAATYTVPARVVKLRKGAALARAGSTELLHGDDHVVAVASDGEYLFLATFTTPARVVRVRKSDLARVDAAVLGAAEGKLNALTPFMGDLFAGSWSEPALVLRLGGWSTPIPCKMSPWGAWGACSTTCDVGRGAQVRARTRLRAPVFGGAACSPRSQRRSCAVRIPCHGCSGGRTWTDCAGRWFGGRATCAAGTGPRGLLCAPGCTCPPARPVWHAASHSCISERQCTATKSGTQPLVTATPAGGIARARPWVGCGVLVKCRVFRGKVHVLFHKATRIGSGWDRDAPSSATTTKAPARRVLGHRCEQAVSASGVLSCTCLCQFHNYQQ
jgi:hypothetical protein